MDSRQPLKEVLGRIVEDMNILAKQLVAIMCIPRENRSASIRESDVAKLVELFKIKEAELAEGMKVAAEQAERQKVIEQLKEEVKKRDECIAKISACFKETEAVLINAIFQANQKLKSIGEANRKKVSPDELIKYAHRISSTNAVAAPLTWQQGDPQRPFPIEMEMWQGWPDRLKERSKMIDKDFGGIMPMGVVGPAGPAPPVGVMPSGAPYPGHTPPQQHEFFMRPQQTGGIFPPPQSPMAACRPPPQPSAAVGGWMSPRALIGAGGQQTSPRIGRPLTPASAASRSPYAATSQAPSVKAQQPATPGSVPNSLEVMSSDSSSSSDSDSQ